MVAARQRMLAAKRGDEEKESARGRRAQEHQHVGVDLRELDEGASRRDEEQTEKEDLNRGGALQMSSSSVSSGRSPLLPCVSIALPFFTVM
jgi:hypothetical protein